MDAKKNVIRSCLNEVLDVLEPADVLLHEEGTVSHSRWLVIQCTNLLLLVLGVFRNEVREALVDAALLKELVKLILERDVERVEL